MIFTEQEFQDAANADALLLAEEQERAAAVITKAGDLGLKKADQKRKLKSMEKELKSATAELRLVDVAGSTEAEAAMLEVSRKRALLLEAVDRRGFHALSTEKLKGKEASIAKSIVFTKEYHESTGDRIGEEARTLYDPKHWDHIKILKFSKRFTYGQTGPSLERNGTAIKVNDPFHVAFNTMKGMNNQILYDAFESHGKMMELQAYMFKVGLRHIDLGDKTQHKEAWDQWAQMTQNLNHRNLKAPAETREDMNGMECKVLFTKYLGAADLLEEVADDKALAKTTASVLRKVHELFKPLFSHLKATKNFLPLVNGKVQNPAVHYKKCVWEYDRFFRASVNSTNGFSSQGIDLMMQPFHVMRDHVPN